jgi:serine/threonine-protein phosphatase PP1 catalytic subunit
MFVSFVLNKGFMKRKLRLETLNRLIDELLNVRSSQGFVRVKSELVEKICGAVTNIFLEEPSVISLSAPIKICGDIHGEFGNLLRVFEIGGLPPTAKYLFLGDYVDRGNRSVEVLLLLFCLNQEIFSTLG